MSKNNKNRFSNKNPYSNFKQTSKPTSKQVLGPVFFLLLIVFSIGYILVYRSHMANSSDSQTNITTETNQELDLNQELDYNQDLNQEPNIQPEEISVSNSSVTIEDTVTVVTNEEPEVPEEPEVSTITVEVSDDRVDYQDGFFYQSITEDIKERIYGKSYKTDCTVPYSDLRYLQVLYVDFDGNTQTGEIICNKALAKDLLEIFYELYTNQYQIDKIRLIDEYDADDDLSCADNNTSCFNYRTVSGSNNLSKHSLGRAIDINPFQNPYVTYPDGKIRISPEGSEPYADRSSGLDHMITENDLCYKLFKAHGFTWGGHWKSLKDYQHFQKVD